MTAIDIYEQASPNSNKKVFVTNDIINQKAAERGSSDEGKAIPSATTLGKNYPNPFNPATTISYRLASAGRVQLTVHNLLGQIMATLMDEVRDAGYYTATWNAENSPSGIYHTRMTVTDELGKETHRDVRKLVLMK